MMPSSAAAAALSSQSLIQACVSPGLLAGAGADARTAGAGADARTAGAGADAGAAGSGLMGPGFSLVISLGQAGAVMRRHAGAAS